MFIIPGFVCYPLMIGITSCWVYSKMKNQWKLNYFKQKELELERFSNISNMSSLNGPPQIMVANGPRVPSHSITITGTTNTTNTCTTNTMHNPRKRDTISEITESHKIISPHGADGNYSQTFTKLDFIDDKIDPRLKEASRKRCVSLSTSYKKSSKSYKSPKGNNSISNIKTSHILNQFLSNTVAFELFAEHLIKEYAVENLLFLVEVEKFKKNCKSKYGKKLCIEQRKLPKSIPPSIDLKAFKNKLKLQFCVLYHKYIDSIKADLSVNVASRNRLICQQLYNEFYEISHGEINGYYSDDREFEYDETSPSVRLSSKGINIPQTPKTNSSFKLKSSSIYNKRNSGSNKSFPNTTIRFRDKNNKMEPVSQQQVDEQKCLKEKDDINDMNDIKEEQNESEMEQEQSTNSKTVSILPPLKIAVSNTASKNNNLNMNQNNNNKLSVSAYMKSYNSYNSSLGQKQRLSTTITPTPSRISGQPYPPNLTININENSLDTRSMDPDNNQLTIYEAQCELTDNEETPAPPTFFTPQITPQGTPLVESINVTKFNQNTENSVQICTALQNDDGKQKEQILSALAPYTITNSLGPITPLSLSPPISRRQSRELTSLSALPDDDITTTNEQEINSNNNNNNNKKIYAPKIQIATENNNEQISMDRAKNLTVKKILSIDSVASQSVTSTTKIEESILSNTVTIGSDSATNTSSNKQNNHFKSISNNENEWSVDGPNIPHIKISLHTKYDSQSFDGDHDTPIPNGLNMDTPIPNDIHTQLSQYPNTYPNTYSNTSNSNTNTNKTNTTRHTHKISRSLHKLQKRTSNSLHLANRIPRNILNQRIDEMMFLMDRKQRNSKPSKDILCKYKDDMDDVQSVIDALDNCLKDVMANLRDSFGRFIFTDAYKRWSGDRD